MENDKKKNKKNPEIPLNTLSSQGRKVRRVRKTSMNNMDGTAMGKKKKKKRPHPESLEVDTSFYKENPKHDERVEKYDNEPQKRKGKKEKRSKKRGCRDFLLGGCSILFVLNLALMGVLVFYAKSAIDVLKEKDTEAIINFLDEKIQDENGILYQSLLEGIVAPELEKGLDETVGNVNKSSDFPIFPNKDDPSNTNTGF